jgi:spore cortex formation protein SpoVR/YcgB (stage V sporulation)
MEDNTTCLMILVLAHAAYGHNHFFKNNYLFKQWTHADSIVDYMLFARNFITECEEKYGYEAVEEILDACHALMSYGVDKYQKPRTLSPQEEQERLTKKIEDNRVLLNDLWRTVPQNEQAKEVVDRHPKQPEENILYFIEKKSPILKEWQREIVRIVRKTSQYFYPQGQTKVANEGCATFSHYEIVNFYNIKAIHNENGYKKIRESLAEQYNRNRYIPDIQVFDVDVYGDRTLKLLYTPINKMDLSMRNCRDVLDYVKQLWGFPVELVEFIDGEEDLIMTV